MIREAQYTKLANNSINKVGQNPSEKFCFHETLTLKLTVIMRVFSLRIEYFIFRDLMLH